MSRRTYIRNYVKINRLKANFKKIEKYIVNLIVLIFFLFIFIFYNRIKDINVSVYGVADIQSFNIDTEGLKIIYDTSKNTNIELEKLLVMYAKSNNYFTENTYVNEFNWNNRNKFFENIKFTFFSLDSENKQVYEVLKSINEDIETMPFEAVDFSNITALNCFSLFKENYGTIFMEKEVSYNEIKVLTVTKGVVESVGYNGDNGLQVVINTDNDIRFVYGNLGKIASRIKVGVNVKSGDVIGTMGNTEEVKDTVSFERSKLSLCIILDRKYFGEEAYINPYPFLYLEAIAIN